MILEEEEMFEVDIEKMLCIYELDIIELVCVMLGVLESYFPGINSTT